MQSSSEERTLPALPTGEWLREVRVDRGRVVETRRIVGFASPDRIWRADWTVDVARLKGDPRSLHYHRDKLDSLADPARPWDAAAAVDPARTRLIDLVEVEGLFFVSNGRHRVARAHQLGFPRVRADWVRVFECTPDAPRAHREFLRSLGPSRVPVLAP